MHTLEDSSMVFKLYYILTEIDGETKILFVPYWYILNIFKD